MASVEQTHPSPALGGEWIFGHLDEPHHFMVLRQVPRRGEERWAGSHNLVGELGRGAQTWTTAH